ncbi:MAG: TolC family protein [Oscillospiraceae bacterium]|nr:TolC family protein [Oscillospiraceae bacterium]
MKKRWTALLLALAMLSALAVGALADEQKKDETAAEETAQTAPDAEGTLRFENLSARMKTGYYTVMSLEENIAAIECIDYDKMYEDLRDNLNLIADYQWGMIQAGQSGSYAYETLEQRYNNARKTFDDIKDGKLQKDYADTVRQLRNMQDSLTAMGESLYVNLLSLEDQSAALIRQTAALDRTIEEVKLRYELGQVSAMTLQQTEAGKAQVESGKAAIDAAVAQLRRQLNAMIGEELTAPLTLNALPEVTAEQLAAMDVEKDLEKAKAASYDLYAAKLTLEDADEEYKDKAGDLGYNKDNYEYIAVKHQWQAAQYTYNAAVQNFELSFRSLYDSVQSYASALNAAKVSLECERSDLAAAQLRYEQGTISENALHTAEDELYTAQDTVSGAERDLFTAYNNYRWAVDYGLLAG